MMRATVATTLDRRAQDLRLGELLLEMGLIDAGELRAMLALQAALRLARGDRAPGIVKRFRLGRLLVDSGILEEATLKQVLRHMRGAGWRQRRLRAAAPAPGPA